MNQEIVKFDIGVIENYVDDADIDFAVMKLRFLSDGRNSHRIPISNEVLKKCADTIIGKPIVAKYDEYKRDVEGHETDEIVVGVVPANANIYYEKTDNGEFACVDGVIFKLYSTNVYELYKSHNERAVSVEMSLEYRDGDNSLPLIGFNIRGVTLLGLDYEPSCTLASSEITRFSKEAIDFYNNKCKTADGSLQEFAERRKSQLSQKKTYKVNKSKDSVSETAWGDVDKTTQRKKIMEAENKSSLVHAVYLKVMDGWEDSPSSQLKYPVMQLKGDTFVYNGDGISSALGYAKQDDPNLVPKIINLQKKLGLYKGEGEEEKMSKEVKDKQKQLEAKKATENASLKEKEKLEEKDTKVLADEDKAKKESEETEGMSSDDNVDAKAYEDMLEIEAEKNKNLTAELEKKDNIIMEMEAELESLKKFKADKEEEDRKVEMTNTFSQVIEKGCNFSKEEKAALEEEGMACKLSELDGWKNKVKAIAFEKQEKGTKTNTTSFKNTSVWSMDSGEEAKIETNNSLWD